MAVPAAGLPQQMSTAALVNRTLPLGKVAPPDGGRFDPKRRRWANLVLCRHGGRTSRVSGSRILAQISRSRPGNPRLNRWDSNAKRGTPSKGLCRS